MPWVVVSKHYEDKLTKNEEIYEVKFSTYY